MTAIPHPQFKYLPALFTITAKTNLHAGAGGENYGVIDNMIQRDPASGFPCIYASSIKGALKEFFRGFGSDYDELITYIFGNERGADEEPNKYKQQAGHYRFLQADLLTIPKPGKNQMFENITSAALIDHFKATLALFNQSLDQLEHVFGAQALSNQEENSKFIERISDFELPVIARNSLENGQSENLWYEQILPRETQLFFIVLYPNPALAQKEAERSQLEAYFETFRNALSSHMVQIGANASVGYGLCQLQYIQLMPISEPANQ
ncbi:MAG: type III-B CRISPR module RAMP protein Cmr4 [Bacteroidota bacterium]